MGFEQANKIKELNLSADEAIEVYGTLVKYINELEEDRPKLKIRLAIRNNRLKLALAENEVVKAQEAIVERYGFDVYKDAITIYPFL